MKIQIGGVPEHFNIPIQNAVEQRLAADQGFELEFKQIKGGSGAMVAGLKDETIDMAVALTECLVAEIEKGGNLRLLSTYVSSPLLWGIHVAPDSNLGVDSLDGKTFGISRHGSGSHVMVHVLARQRGWKRAPLFHVCNDFATLREDVRTGKIDAFLWEKFMTRPYHVSGEVKTIGETPTPWPCFSIAVRPQFAAQHADALKKIVAVIAEACQAFKSDVEGSLDRVCADFGLSRTDAKAWFDAVEFSVKDPCVFSRAMLEDTRATLVSAGVLPGLSAAAPESATETVHDATGQDAGQTAGDISEYLAFEVAMLV